MTAAVSMTMRTPLRHRRLAQAAHGAAALCRERPGVDYPGMIVAVVYIVDQRNRLPSGSLCSPSRDSSRNKRLGL